MSKWQTIKVQDEQKVDFSSDNPHFTGTLNGDKVTINLKLEHEPFYKEDADNISVRGDLLKGLIDAEMIRSYKMMSITATVGGIKGEDKSNTITAYDNNDMKENKSQRYFLKVSHNKLDVTANPLTKGTLITAKGYVIETQKGDRQMNVLGMKTLSKEQQQDHFQKPSKNESSKIEKASKQEM